MLNAGALPLVRNAPSVEPDELCEGVGGLGTCGPVAGPELEPVVRARVVVPEAQQASDDLHADALRRIEARRPELRPNAAGGVAEVH